MTSRDTAIAAVDAYAADAAAQATAADQAAEATLQSQLAAAQALAAAAKDALAAETADDAAQKTALAALQKTYDAYVASHPDSPPPPPPPPTGVAFGTAVNQVKVYADLKADGVVPDSVRVFYDPGWGNGQGIPATWADDPRLPQTGLAILSFKDDVPVARVTGLVKSAPPAVTVYLTYKHEVENNISAAFTIDQFHSQSALYSDACEAAGGHFGLILTGYTGSDAAIKGGGKPVSYYFVPGKHKWFGVDFYSDRDVDQVIARTTAFAVANKIAWAVTECGMATKNGTDAQRAAYAALIRGKFQAATPKPFASTWWTDSSNANFQNPLTPAVAKAFFGVGP